MRPAKRIRVSRPLFRNCFEKLGTDYRRSTGRDFVTGMNRDRIDMATPYLREALRFIGISDVRFVLIGPTTGPLPPVKAARESAHRRLTTMAASF